MTDHSGALPVRLAWACVILPAVAVHAVYLLSAGAGHVPWCVPYIDGCTSISRAARQGLANPVFKATMLPNALLLAALWGVCALWLRQVSPQRKLALAAMLAFGWSGALCLLLYAWFVGGDSDAAMFMRRYGGVVYFSFTAFAQMALTAAIFRDSRFPAWLRRSMLALCLGMLILGLGSIPIQNFVAERYTVVSAIEWNYSLLMTAFFGLIAVMWRQRRNRPPALNDGSA